MFTVYDVIYGITGYVHNTNLCYIICHVLTICSNNKLFHRAVGILEVSFSHNKE